MKMSYKFNFFYLFFIGFVYYYGTVFFLGKPFLLNSYASIFGLDSNGFDYKYKLFLLIYLFTVIILAILLSNLNELKVDNKFIDKVCELKFYSTVSTVICIILSLIILIKSGFSFNLRKSAYNELADLYISLLAINFLICFFSTFLLGRKVGVSLSRLLLIGGIFYFLLLTLNQRMGALTPVFSLFVFYSIGRGIFNKINFVFIFLLLIILIILFYDADFELLLATLEGHYVSSIANSVFYQEISWDPNYLLYMPVKFFSSFSDLFIGFESANLYYYSTVKEALYPDASHGLGYSIAAEFYLNFGFLGAFLLGFYMYCLILCITKMYNTTNLNRLILISFSFQALIFINRNSIFSFIVIIKFFIVLLFLYRTSFFLYKKLLPFKSYSL